jgi:hypothetical protein
MNINFVCHPEVFVGFVVYLMFSQLHMLYGTEWGGDCELL